jgi:hypothetical protein
MFFIIFFGFVLFFEEKICKAGGGDSGARLLTQGRWKSGCARMTVPAAEKTAGKPRVWATMPRMEAPRALPMSPAPERMLRAEPLLASLTFCTR